MSKMSDYKNMRVVVIGAARQGMALSRYLVEHGAYVVLNDRRSVTQMSHTLDALADLSKRENALQWVLGGHPLSLLDQADLVCVSGGVPLTLPLLQEAQAKNIPLSNDSQIFLEVAPCKVVGITGSAGKTTTTSLFYQITQEIHDPISHAFRKAWIGGNIGSPLIKEVDQMSSEDLAIMELSSFQLEIMEKSPQVATVLNLSPNHLDRHGTMDVYRSAKAHILDYQNKNDLAILGRDDPGAWGMRSSVQGRLVSFGKSVMKYEQEGTFLSGESIYWESKENHARKIDENSLARRVCIISQNEIPLRGEHNLQNVLAASAIAMAIDFPPEAVSSAIRKFKHIPHRLEFIRSWGGADWYNDSIATAPERSIAAIKSFDEPIVLLAGGRDKDLPWDEFVDLVRDRVDHLILFGEAAEKIQNTFQLSEQKHLTIERCTSLQDTVQLASEIIEPGDVVLLSPGGTSFDEFADFEERGNYFSQWVRKLP
jgi:UDP-N-acetylmuramoylalanine--D-glutamate ligase